jgi:diguanylate cyclase (GGDEF)-like protein
VDDLKNNRNSLQQGLRLLIVEELDAEAELAARRLAGGGVRCSHLRVASEESFRAALAGYRPHFILSDFAVPGFDGLTALDIATREAPDSPFIFLSSAVGEERAILALRRGAVDYVLKSNPARLVPAVQRALREVRERVRRRNAERQIRQSEQRLRRLTRALQLQSGVNAAVVRVTERDELLREACRLALQVGGYELAVVSLVSPDGKIARPYCWLGSDDDTIGFDGIRFPLSNGSEGDTSLLSRALRTGEIAYCADLNQSEPPVHDRKAWIQHGFKSIVALPLTVDGARLGVLTLASRDSEFLSDEELVLLQDVVASLSFALQYRRHEQVAQLLAYFDQLTGLAKRALFCERLDTLLRGRTVPEGGPTVVAFDVMHLSNVNNTFGRHVGDLLLQRVADRLKHQFDDDESLGYLDGGTFVFVLPQTQTTAESVTALLEGTVFREAFHIEGRDIRASFKTGFARFPVDGVDGSTLVQRAEAALKHAKESGEQYLHYQIQMHSAVAERLALEHRLRIALDERQFILHYQPQVNITTGRIESVEALLRWLDPQHGLVHPGHFLPVLESSGMIVTVGEWVLQQAVEDCLRWRGMRLGPVRIAVNVSSQQIRRRAFVEQFLSAANACRGEGFGIDMEITETGLLLDVEGASRKLRDLRAAGMRIAIDDFGTGYSSLGLLSQLPVDLLKIDRSFISGLPDDPASATLVSSIIGLASAFNLTTVAEGVETREQFDLLRRLKCDQSQGYLHSRPVAAKDIERMLLAPVRNSSTRAALSRP